MMNNKYETILSSINDLKIGDTLIYHTGGAHDLYDGMPPDDVVKLQKYFAVMQEENKHEFSQLKQGHDGYFTVFDYKVRRKR